MSAPESSGRPEFEVAAAPLLARRLELDDAHTLVLYPRDGLDGAQRRYEEAGGSGVLGDRGHLILLFRAGGQNGAEVPRLWVEEAGSSWPAELLRATGWGQAPGPAVALLTFPGGLGASATGPGPTVIHLRAGHLELATPLPELWREHLGESVPVAG